MSCYHLHFFTDDVHAVGSKHVRAKMLCTHVSTNDSLPASAHKTQKITEIKTFQKLVQNFIYQDYDRIYFNLSTFYSYLLILENKWK